HPAARLEASRAAARRQAADLRRRHGQLLPQQRGLQGGRVPEEGRPAGTRGGGLRRPRRALLERRPHAGERVLPAALPADDAAVGGRANATDRAAGGGFEELAILTGTGDSATKPLCSSR